MQKKVKELREMPTSWQIQNYKRKYEKIADVFGGYFSLFYIVSAFCTFVFLIEEEMFFWQISFFYLHFRNCEDSQKRLVKLTSFRKHMYTI